MRAVVLRQEHRRERAGRPAAAANRASGDRAGVLDAVLEEHLAGFEPPSDAEAALTFAGADSHSSEALDALLVRIRSRAAESSVARIERREPSGE